MKFKTLNKGLYSKLLNNLIDDNEKKSNSFLSLPKSSLTFNKHIISYKDNSFDYVIPLVEVKKKK